MIKKFTDNSVARYLLIGGLVIISLYLVVWVRSAQLIDQSSATTIGTTAGQTQLDQAIAASQSRIANFPDERENYLTLAELYLEKVRLSGDGSSYNEIDKLVGAVKELDRAGGSRDIRADVLATEAALALSRHDFKEAEKRILEAITKEPATAAYYGILGDALIELGQYEAAAEAVQEMVDRKPNFNAFSRVAYVRELFGDQAGAREALGQAISAGSPNPSRRRLGPCRAGKVAAGSRSNTTGRARM